MSVGDWFFIMKGFAFTFVLGVLAAGASAQVFDITTGFSTTLNPNGTWSVGRASSGLAAGFTLNTSAVADYGVWQGWGSSTIQGTASQSGFVGKNTGATQFNCPAGAVVFAPGDPALIPNGNLTYAVYRWTGPPPET